MIIRYLDPWGYNIYLIGLEHLICVGHIKLSERLDLGRCSLHLGVHKYLTFEMLGGFDCLGFGSGVQA